MLHIDVEVQNDYKPSRLLQLIELVQSDDLSIERASQKVGMTVDEFEKKMKELFVSIKGEVIGAGVCVLAGLVIQFFY